MQQIDEFTDKVISVLETARQEAGMTVQELIVKSGMRRSTYFRKMRGDTDFTTSDIDAIAKALNVDPFLILRKATAAVEESHMQVNQNRLSDDEIKAAVNKKIENGMFGLAAMHDADDGNWGVDEEFA